MSAFTPSDTPIPATGPIKFSTLRSTFGNAAYDQTKAKFSMSDLHPNSGLNLNQPTTNLKIQFFRGKSLPDVSPGEVQVNIPINDATVYDFPTTFTNNTDVNINQRLVRTANVTTANSTVQIPEAKRGISRLLQGVLKTSNLSVQNTFTGAPSTSFTIVNENVPVSIQVRKRNFMVKSVNTNVDLRDQVVPMRVRFNIATTNWHSGVHGNHHTHTNHHVNTPYSGRHHGRHLNVHRRKKGHQMKRRNHYHQNIHQHYFSGVHNVQNHTHHHHNHAFQYRWTRYDGVQFTNVLGSLTVNSFQYHLNQISGCHTLLTPNASTARTNVNSSVCVANSSAGQCTNGSPHSRAACTTTFSVGIKPFWTTTQITGSSSIALTNAGT